MKLLTTCQIYDDIMCNADFEYMSSFTKLFIKTWFLYIFQM